MLKRRTAWLYIGLLTSIILVLASCGTSSTSSTPSSGTTASQPSKTSTAPANTGYAQQTQTASATKPKYGGVYNGFVNADTSNWDPGQKYDLAGWQISVGNEALMSGDWAKGPAGTGQADWMTSLNGNPSLAQGLLATSYEIPDNQHLIFHIRQGVKWWNKAPANGREFTADDVVWNIKKQWALPGGNYQSFFSKADYLVDAVALDKYTVELTVPLNSQGIHWWEDGQRCYMMLPELFPKQADGWQQQLGTGPYMVTDYVAGSSMTWARNQNYWQTNPVGPGKGDKLPYLDGFNIYVIPDLATQEAAFRTGKVDAIPGVTWEDWQNLLNTMAYKPAYVQTYGDTPLPQGREDKANLPFKDVRVRQAMNYAVDKQSILKDYYQGHADLLGWPFYNTPTFSGLYTPLDQMPAEVQALEKGGDVAKAKQLLTDAGYPNGFKTTIYSNGATMSDFLSIIKAQLAQVNIDMSINQVDPGVFSNMERAQNWPEMWYHSSKEWFLTQYMFEMLPTSNDSGSFWGSPQTDQVYSDIKKYMAVDDAKWRSELKDVIPFVLQQSFAIWLPVSYKYNMWQPWIQNYYGCTNMSAFQPLHVLDYTWIDQNLKSSLGK